MKPHPAFTLKRLPLYISAAFVAAAPAYSAPYHADAGYTLGGAAAVTEPAQDSATSVDILTFTGDGTNEIGIHTFGSAADFGSRSSGTNSFDVNGLFRLTTSVAGDSFSFNIVPGQVAAYGSTGFGATEFESSHIHLKITVDTVEQFASDALVTVGAGGVVTSSQTGANIGYSFNTGVGFGVYSISGGLQTLSGLGLGTHDIVYEMFSEAHGKVLASNLNTCLAPVFSGGGVDGTPTVADGGGAGADTFLVRCSAVAQSGDPIVSPTAVPEPASGSLLGLGLLGVALAGLKARKKTKNVSH